MPLPADTNLSLTEAAALLGVRPGRLRRYAAAGALPSYRLARRTRFCLAEVRAFQERAIDAYFCRRFR